MTMQYREYSVHGERRIVLRTGRDKHFLMNTSCSTREGSGVGRIVTRVLDVGARPPAIILAARRKRNIARPLSRQRNGRPKY
jgi:hypothetical protein